MKMALKPLIKVKVDELFLFWLSETETQELLRTNLRQIQNGEQLTTPAQSSVNYGKTQKPQSPRGIRPSSPSTPPCSPATSKISSPRSPRRVNNNRRFNLTQKNSTEKEVTVKEDRTHARGEPDGKANDSHRQKESQRIQLRQPKPKQKPQDDNRTVIKNEPEVKPKPLAVEKKEKTRKDPSTAQKTVKIPQFYFPHGQPTRTDDNEAVAQKIKAVFCKLEGGKAHKQHFGQVAKACGFPMYWQHPLFLFAGGGKNGYVTLQSMLACWKKLCHNCHDEASYFMRIVAKPGSKYLEEDDFFPLIQDVVDTHPGLSFLLEAPEFHSRYIQTVIARIFYCVNRSWSGKITVHELRRSHFLQTLHFLEEEEDINRIMDYFSYEHFYVIYCKFWEIDVDHDLFISKEDLARHNDHAISSRMIDRIFSGAVTRNLVDDKLTYKDFVWFLISEEDKRHPTSIEYWFRCMDFDGDGVISMYEMEYFYEEQVQKMEALGIETLPFKDCLCQMLDMVKPKITDQITLRDLKACKLTPIFFDTFFNLDKYLDHEQRDPFANVRDTECNEDGELSDWERFAADEYELLVAEEGANEMQQDEMAYEDDFEPEDEDIPTITKALDALERPEISPPSKSPGTKPVSKTDDDIYDFSNQDLGY